VNTLTGSGYNDSLIGGAGPDTLAGILGKDSLSGGLGADVFVFITTPNPLTHKDTITDFSAADDDIWLAKSILAGLRSATGA
jgi:Ca2+-binding RTX toxin-like protein